MAEEGRPVKRQKTKNWEGGGNKGKTGDKSKYRSQAAYAQKRANISASGLQSGDVGMFVTCDKGKEKACLREMEDLLSEELGLDNDSAPTNTLPEGDKNEKTQAEAAPSDNADRGIEDDIERELAELAGQSVAGEKRKRPSETTSGEADSASKTAKLGLVTLDIPCVSFVRFPLGFEHEPVSVVTKICRDAESQPERQRSRFIKRLTPLSRVRKVMSGGVEELCKDVLPPVFGDGQPRKYAVRVTVRNNNQVEKDQIIKTVAGAVRELGLVGGDDAESKHKVSLKGYDNLVLVEIYRNVVGMSVVGDDWERLRRFNLSEIYAEGRKAKNDSESQRKPAVTEVQSAD